MHLEAHSNPFQRSQRTVPSQCSSSAMVLSTSVSWRGAFHLSGALAFMSGAPVFVTAAQQIPFDCLALVTGEAFLPGSLWTVAV